MSALFGVKDYMHCILDPEKFKVTFHGDCRGWYGSKFMARVIVQFKFVDETILGLREKDKIDDSIIIESIRRLAKIPPSKAVTIEDILYTRGTLSFQTDKPATLEEIVALCGSELIKVCSDPIDDDLSTQAWVYKMP